jgi:LuxR family maltose regulon positive regulatory protein
VICVALLTECRQAQPDLIYRHDLVAALDHAAEKKVTIISAPARSGKTSLLRGWPSGSGSPDRLHVSAAEPA